ncbi:hypothetical protein FGIG_11799 [Fasciola gigantica]|uniref:Uncharacterized protein n=1 Tax=Fasciola gigantica TaxID=46835 RepID=A0A504YNR9_FASGI|nr:hypothetical protein FGIG_11799 [Fasciola gigantica]
MLVRAFVTRPYFCTHLCYVFVSNGEELDAPSLVVRVSSVKCGIIKTHPILTNYSFYVKLSIDCSRPNEDLILALPSGTTVTQTLGNLDQMQPIPIQSNYAVIGNGTSSDNLVAGRRVYVATGPKSSETTTYVVGRSNSSSTASIQVLQPVKLMNVIGQTVRAPEHHLIGPSGMQSDEFFPAASHSPSSAALSPQSNDTFLPIHQRYRSDCSQIIPKPDVNDEQFGPKSTYGSIHCSSNPETTATPGAVTTHKLDAATAVATTPGVGAQTPTTEFPISTEDEQFNTSFDATMNSIDIAKFFPGTFSASDDQLADSFFDSTEKDRSHDLSRPTSPPGLDPIDEEPSGFYQSSAHNYDHHSDFLRRSLSRSLPCSPSSVEHSIYAASRLTDLEALDEPGLFVIKPESPVIV